MLEIRAVKNPGLASRERVVIDVLAYTNIGMYMLFKSVEYSDGSVSSKVKDPFWFPDQDVEPGDIIVVHTCAGTDRIVDNSSGSRTLHYYLGKILPRYKGERAAAVLALVDSWQSKVR
jgi:hypothetical protein